MNLTVPKPSFANVRTRSVFGFQAATIPEMDDRDAQDGEHQDTNMVADIDHYAAYVEKMDDSNDLYLTDNESRAVPMEVDRRKSGMIHPLSFNTLTFFARRPRTDH